MEVAMTASKLIEILEEYIRTYGDQFVTIADAYSVLGDAESVLLTDDGDFAITFNN